jgi:hypothetical protein
MRRAALSLLVLASAAFPMTLTRPSMAWAGGQFPSTLKSPPLGLPGTSQTKDRAAVVFAGPIQTTIPAHRSTAVELHFHVADGLHINSHAPHEKTLIPTRLAVEEPPGLTVTAVDFPPGSEFALKLAPQEKLSVYSGDFVLRAHITGGPGQHLLRGALRYQACDINACMPPTTLAIEIGILGQ